MKYFLKDIEGELVCYSVDKEGHRSYINSRRDFGNLVSYLKQSGFQIKTNYVDLKLEGKNISLVVKDYETVFRHRECSSLVETVDNVYEKQGAIDTTKTQNISRNHNHSNKHAGKFARRVGAVVLTGAVLLGAYSGIKAIGSKNDNVLPTPKIEYGYMVEDTRTAEEIEETIPSITYEEEESTTLEKVQEVVDTEVEINNESTLELEYERLYDTDKALNCKDRYYDLIREKAAMFGVDAKMMLGIATQERGVHSRTIDDGGGVGLMQLQYGVWAGETITAHKLNPETGKYEKYSVKVTDDNIRNLDTNVEIACMVMQNCLDYTAYNIPMAIQMYNQGYGSIHEALEEYCRDTGQERVSVCYNPVDVGWIPYCAQYDGDPEYLTNVLKWCEDTHFSNYDYDAEANVAFTFTSSFDLRR